MKPKDLNFIDIYTSFKASEVDLIVRLTSDFSQSTYLDEDQSSSPRNGVNEPCDITCDAE
jgi:hypothetical protein